jgi:molybdopterin/thiamine biosynthesis adenylyltransferase
MSISIRLTKQDYSLLRGHLLKNPDYEEAALLTCGYSKTHDNTVLLVHEVIPVPDTGLLHKGGAGLTIDPDFMMPIIKKCLYSNLSIILTHSHPFSGTHVGFSGIDDFGESVLIPKFQERVPDVPHGAIVFGRDSIAARIWLPDKNEPHYVDEIVIAGRALTFIPLGSTNHIDKAPSVSRQRYDRQILIFSEEIQDLIQSLKIAIVGVGGIGSQVLQQIAHLGTKNIILVDPDTIEESNLSRLVGSVPSDVEKKLPKVEIGSRLAKQINPDIEIRSVIGSIYDLSVAKQILDSDVVFCCTDNLTSRMVLNRIAYQYLIPVIDTGINIQINKDGTLHNAAGRVTVLLPDEPCLSCLDILNPEQLSREAMQYSSDGTQPHIEYVTGQTAHAPAVISLNGVVAALAVTEFLDLLTPLENQRDPNNFQCYRVTAGIVQLYPKENLTGCTICGEVKGQGDTVELPCRLDK